ncbi:MAG: [protein-PII] uridylyltransferase [Thiotrichales bacterium]|jgi:[protein-PII] uridylyltransferase|nr:[protein-PII] uridylyltransferase [Thiotrichales bacterium]
MTLPTPLLVQSLKNPKEAVSVGRSLLANLQTQQWQRFENKAPIQHLISERTNFIDQLLRRVWKHHIGQTQRLCLVAVGGYGRGELHPYSDIDILILTTEDGVNKTEQQQLEAFITYLWDIGLQVGHAIRSIVECYEIGKDDISTATNYTEARWLIGHYEAFDELRQLWKKRDFWPSRAFFLAKVDEQIQRHNKAHDALAQLEPNIKESPGGLRDIHTIAWVAKRHFGANSLQQLVSVGFLSVSEYNDLERSMRFHWRVRFVLHSLTKRKEERLLFEHQKRIAQTLGYTDSAGKLAVEAFMQDYYRNAKTIQRLNTLLLQHFREDLIAPNTPEVKPIDAHFTLINDAISVNSEQSFIQEPIQLLRCFILLESTQASNIRANTQRIIQNYAHLINEQFCSEPTTWQTFRTLLSQPIGVTRSLRIMHSLGLLGRLLPAFHRITGLMQFDLFHAYTVDEHTLFVVRNLRQFMRNQPETQANFPLACRIAQQIQFPDILLLAALFHDIAKGRGGDHAILGALDALQFAQQAGLTEKEQKRMAWLVEQHLLMSHTAQKKDISDAEVIQQFGQQVGSIERLNNLYLLTVADICATSPVVWNGWKDNLLASLYHRTLAYLQNKPKALVDAQQALLDMPKQAQEQVISIWNSLKNSPYHQQQTADDLYRHAHLFIDQQTLPKIGMRPTPVQGVCSLTIYAEDIHGEWLMITAACDQAKLDIVEARVYTTNDGHVLIDLKFLSPLHWSTADQAEFIHALSNSLKCDDMTVSPHFHRQHSRQKHFTIKTEIDINQHNLQTEVTLISSDRPGLLFKCALVFHQQGLNLVSARISTAGMRAEDVFLLSNLSKQPLNEQQQRQLKQALIDTLN